MAHPLFFVSKFYKDYIILKNKKTAAKAAKKEGILKCKLLLLKNS